METFTTLSFATYESSDGGVTFERTLGFSDNDPATYTETGGSIPFELEAGEMFSRQDFSGAPVDVTFLGRLTIASNTFLLWRQGVQHYLDTIDVVPVVTEFPSSFSTTDPEFSTANFVFCFLEGTLIRTPTGDVPVERLAIGDAILTATGASTTVEWIGRQSVAPRFGGSKMLPVRITAGALGHGLPETDLCVSADHGLILDDLVVNAGALVNGTTITVLSPADLPERITYYHVETTAHGVILANGTPAETFIDYAGRQGFDNYAEFEALFGADRTVAELPLPRISAARHLPETLRQRLGLARSAA